MCYTLGSSFSLAKGAAQPPPTAVGFAAAPLPNPLFPSPALTMASQPKLKQVQNSSDFHWHLKIQRCLKAVFSSGTFAAVYRKYFQNKAMCGKASEVTGKSRWPSRRRRRRSRREFTWVGLHVDVCSRHVIAYGALALHGHVLRRRHGVAVTRASPMAAHCHTQRGRGHGALAWLLHRHVVRTYKNYREQQGNLGCH